MADRRRLARDLAWRLAAEPGPKLRQARADLQAQLGAEPRLVTETELHPHLDFGDLANAVEQLNPDVAAQAVSSWMLLRDRRLNKQSREDIQAPVERLPMDVLTLCSVEVIALLEWSAGVAVLSERPSTEWPDFLAARTAVGGTVVAEDVPAEVLAADLALAAKLGPAAAIRAAVECESLGVEPFVSALRELWRTMAKSQPEELAGLVGPLRGLGERMLEDESTLELPAPLVVTALWSELSSGGEAWLLLDDGTAVMALYRAIAGGYPIDTALARDCGPQSRVVSLILEGGESSESGLLRSLADYVTGYVIDWGWHADTAPDLSALLPGCAVLGSGVALCEGRLWASSDRGDAWCPRLRAGCSTHDGALVGASPALPWWRWSLSEALVGHGRTGLFLGHEPLANALAGWVNRWADVRQRIRCRTCGAVMAANYELARNLDAAYRTTVMDCHVDGPGHDRGVYLSHCNGCNGPIDSRDLPVRIDGYYLCDRCGAGPASVLPGEICPRCHDTNIEATGRRGRRCRTCRHEVVVPHSAGSWDW